MQFLYGLILFETEFLGIGLYFERLCSPSLKFILVFQPQKFEKNQAIDNKPYALDANVQKEKHIDFMPQTNELNKGK